MTTVLIICAAWFVVSCVVAIALGKAIRLGNGDPEPKHARDGWFLRN